MLEFTKPGGEERGKGSVAAHATLHTFQQDFIDPMHFDISRHLPMMVPRIQMIELEPYHYGI